MKITNRHSITARAAISHNDGMGRIDPVSVLIVVDSHPLHTSDPSVGLNGEAFDDWVCRYIDGRDLRLAFDFPATPTQLAVYLAITFQSMDARVARVCVSFDGGTVVMVDTDDE